MKVYSNADILGCARPREVIDTLADAFAQSFDSPERMHCELPGSDDAKLLIMPAWQGRTAIGVKIATVMPENCQQQLPTVDGVYVLMDGQTGTVTAILDAPALTALRTAAVSALASRFMSRQQSKTLLVVGTGALAPHLARAHASVRDFDEILVWGRNANKAALIVAALSDLSVEITVRVALNLQEAVASADIVSCATLSTAPLIMADWVNPGTHLDFVGSFSPQMREADPELFRNARTIVDTQTALRESGDILGAIADGILCEPIPELADLARGLAKGRCSDQELTIFKSVGTGLSDIATARYIVDKMMATGPGEHNIMKAKRIFHA